MLQVNRSFLADFFLLRNIIYSKESGWRNSPEYLLPLHEALRRKIEPTGGCLQSLIMKCSSEKPTACSLQQKVDLSAYNNRWYSPGRGKLLCIIWYMVNALFFQNPLQPSSKIKVFLLRLFGAKVGKGVVLKPRITIKYPWNLSIGNFSWIGENVWLDNLVPISIGSNVCISQGAYFCTGNHDWSDPAFGLLVKPIVIEDGVWVGAKSTILPGVTLKYQCVIASCSVVVKDTEKQWVYSGNPAIAKKQRRFSDG